METVLAQDSDTLEVEVTRGSAVESRHRVAVALVDVAGRAQLRHGAIDQPVYARSALKPIQALALVETGAAAAFAVTPRELALACASHNGEPMHVDAVRAWLARLDLDERALECGAHLPNHPPSAAALLRGGDAPSAAHNNCSGKHAGFLTVARHLGHPTAGYIRPEHPVQQHVLGAIEQMVGLDLGRAPRGTDGCGIPVIGVPLENLAYAMARFGAPDNLPDARATAARRLYAAMAATPEMVAGSGRFCTIALQALGGRGIVKTGAEGVFMAAFPEFGLGAALKVIDGARRAAEVAMATLIFDLGLVDAEKQPTLRRYLHEPLHNHAGTAVGEVRMAGRP
jgi:L-asparaginase II